MRQHEFKYFDSSRTIVDAKDNVISKPYDGSKLYNIKPASVVVAFSMEGSENATWNDDSTVTLTHSLNCYPIVQVYSADGTQVYPEITIISGTSFKLDFSFSNPIPYNETWICTITYGAEYGTDGNINDNVGSILSSMQELHDSVVELLRYEVGHATAYAVLQNGTQLSFTWTDPTDFITNGGVTAARWGKTRLIMKTGGFPENEKDGTVLVDNTIRDQYRENAFVWDAGVISNYYFALFTCTTDGIWNTGDDSPRFTTDLLTWQTIAMLTRSNSLLTYPGMAIGSVVDVQVNSLCPKLRYKLAHVNYSAHFPSGEINQWHYDHTKRFNSVWMPNYLPCLEDSNKALQSCFDSPELQYAQTWDATFNDNKTYYRYYEESYVALEAGTDYQVGDSVATYTLNSGNNVYTKNHDQIRNYGYNNWAQSNIRQWLQATGTGWFQKQNEYDVNGINYAGWLTGFSPEFLSIVQPVYNKTARNTVDGGGFDITLDKFWLPSIKEVFSSDNNNISEGQQFAYFRDIAVAKADRIQCDEGGTARNVWLRSANTGVVYNEYCIHTSGANGNNLANSAYALMPIVCIA